MSRESRGNQVASHYYDLISASLSRQATEAKNSYETTYSDLDGLNSKLREARGGSYNGVLVLMVLAFILAGLGAYYWTTIYQFMCGRVGIRLYVIASEKSQEGYIIMGLMGFSILYLVVDGIGLAARRANRGRYQKIYKKSRRLQSNIKKEEERISRPDDDCTRILKASFHQTVKREQDFESSAKKLFDAASSLNKRESGFLIRFPGILYYLASYVICFLLYLLIFPYFTMIFPEAWRTEEAVLGIAVLATIVGVSIFNHAMFSNKSKFHSGPGCAWAIPLGFLVSLLLTLLVWPAYWIYLFFASGTFKTIMEWIVGIIVVIVVLYFCCSASS